MELKTLIVGVYIDDMIIISISVEGIKEFKQQMMKEFEMADLGLLMYYLGIEVNRRRLHHAKFIGLLLRRCCTLLSSTMSG